MPKTRIAISLLCLGALAAPAAASADTVHVSTAGADAPACGAVASPCATLPYALANRVTAGPDVVALGPGEFSTAGTTVGNANAAGDVIQGVGSQGAPAGTQLTHSNAGGDPQLTLDVPLTIRALRFRLPVGSMASRYALSVGAGAGGTRIEDVSVLAENASTATALVSVGAAAGVVVDRLTTLPSGSHSGDGLRFAGSTGAVVQDSSLRGGDTAAGNALSLGAADAVVRRTKLSRGFGFAGLDPVVESLDSSLTVESSLIAGGRIGVNSQAAPGKTASLTLRGATVDVAAAGVADGGIDRNPVYIRTTMPGVASSTARIERSVLVEPVYAFAEAGSTVKVDCLDSIVPLDSSALVACGAGNGNSAAAPSDVFANATLGDWHLKPGSPAVDGAAADVAPGESSTDLDGNPRVLDGNADCAARADRGAYELTGNAADPASCVPVPPGPGPGPGPGTTDVAPVLSKASFTKPAFTTTGKKKGTAIRFRLSEAATLTMSIDRALPGRRRGSKCVAPTRKNRKAKSCTRYAKAGSLTFKAKAGTNSLAFSGKVGKKTLAPGTYRARLVARDATKKTSKTLTLTFRVVAARKK